MNSDIPIAGANPALAASSSSEPDIQHLEVGRGAVHEIRVQADTDDIIQWEFKTKSFDIGFSVFLTKNNGEPEEIVAKDRVETHKRTHVVETSGVFVFCWDNSYSWTRGKTVKYYICKNSVPIQ